MASRASLNKVLLIGNLTRDPELRYTPSGAAVCTFSVATNRSYTAADGTKKEEAEFIRIVSWNKLAELCSQLLAKGRKVYVEGRLQTRSWETPDGQSKQTTEVVIDDMRILDSKRSFEEGHSEDYQTDESTVKTEEASVVDEEEKESKGEKSKIKKPTGNKKLKEEDKNDKPGNKEEDKVDLDDLPF